MFRSTLVLAPFVLFAGLACVPGETDSDELEFRTDAEEADDASAIVIAPDPNDPESVPELICIDELLDDEDPLDGTDFPYETCNCDTWAPWGLGTVLCYGYLPGPSGCVPCCADYAISHEGDGTC